MLLINSTIKLWKWRFSLNKNGGEVMRNRRRSCLERALDLELKALDEITEPVEPTYSILHRSAGWLALDCNKPRLAEQLACKALAGDPYPKIAEELRDLLAETYARMHLQLGKQVLRP